MGIRDILQTAIDARGSQHLLAAACGLSQASISKALKRGRCSPKMAVLIEGATGIDRRRLCPEFFTPAVRRPALQLIEHSAEAP